MPEISGIIGREIELISQFITVLSEEQEYLKQGNAAALPAISGTKSTLVAQLNALEGERMAAIGLPGKPSTRSAMEDWLAQRTSDTKISVDWQKLLVLAGEAKTLHELNGRLIAMHLKNTNELLGILTQPTDKPALYGASGQSLPATGSRIVDSA